MNAFRLGSENCFRIAFVLKEASVLLVLLIFDGALTSDEPNTVTSDPLKSSSSAGHSWPILRPDPMIPL